MVTKHITYLVQRCDLHWGRMVLMSCQCSLLLLSAHLHVVRLSHRYHPQSHIEHAAGLLQVQRDVRLYAGKALFISLNLQCSSPVA